MLALDIASNAPIGGIAGLVCVLMGMQYRSNNDQRKAELTLRAEFAKERALLRAECAEERDRDRAEILNLQQTVDRLRVRVDDLSGSK